VDALIQAKAGINYRTANGASALVLAAELGSGELVNLLLQNKADVDIADAQGATALHWAVQKGDAKTSESLLRASGKLNVSDAKGNTPLLLAVGKGRVQLTAMLLASGHDPDHQNNDGISARELAKRGKLTAISTLIDANEHPTLEAPTYTKLASFDRMQAYTET